MDHRLWMYNMHYETGAGLKLEFIDGFMKIINDAFEVQGGMEPKYYFDEYPNKKAKHFYAQLEESSRPLCEGSRHSSLETGDFYSYYFGDDVSCRINRPNRNDEGDIDPLFPSISIFNQNGRGSIKRGKRGFTNMEMQSVVTHILLNFLEIQPYLNLFVNTWGNAAIYTEFSKWPTNYFQTEEVSRNKKTNNSSIYIRGHVDGTGQTIKYYGIIHEIIEVRYSGCPKKNNVLFRYDPFIIAQNAKQVYYAPYLLCRDKVDWWVVIKAKHVGRIEIDNVLDVAYQNDVTIVHQHVDVELETKLQHPQHILEEVSDDEIMNVEEEIFENEENESFDDKEWDNNQNETIEEEEWKNNEIEPSKEEYYLD
ncbi:hypothetical protein H5410_022034 [Solanum commersonii]|uniref:DUF4216 domain-containing protein n=1 Tax=Solanum commersonii TaxID=4109 RepID=A0A9J5ZD12_SOLCO|nr:hypothetical protein H5410_022034 [Solanum commersonii]